VGIVQPPVFRLSISLNLRNSCKKISPYKLKGNLAVQFRFQEFWEIVLTSMSGEIITGVEKVEWRENVLQFLWSARQERWLLYIPYTSTLRKSEFFSLPLTYMFDMALGIKMIIYLKRIKQLHILREGQNVCYKMHIQSLHICTSLS